MARWLANGALLLFAGPLLVVLVHALEPGSGAAFAHLARTVLPGAVGTTLALCVVTVVLATGIGAGAACLVSLHDFPARRLLDGALVLPLALPSYLVAVVYRELAHVDGWPAPVTNLWGAALVMSLTLYPYVFLLARAAFRRQGAIVSEAGLATGVGGARLARRVVWPLALPAIGLGAMLVAVETLSELGAVQALDVTTLTVVVRRVWLQAFDPVLAMQVSLLLALLPLLLVAGYGVLVGRHAVYMPANRARAARRRALMGPWRRVTPLLLGVPVVLGFVVPVAAMMHQAVEGLPRTDLSDLFARIGNSLTVALVTTAAALLLGLWLALVARQRGRAWRSGAACAVLASYALPAMVLAFAVLTVTAVLRGWPAGRWLDDTLVPLLIAVTLRYTAFAHLGARSGLDAVSPRVDEAARCTGQGAFAATWRVVVPMTRGALLAGGMLVFINALKELTLSLTLQPFGFTSLSLSTWHLANVDAWQQGAVHGLALVLVGLYPVWSIHRWFDRR